MLTHTTSLHALMAIISLYVSPTPRNGVNIPAYVNIPLEIRVRARARYSSISDLIVTGPRGVAKRRISTEEFAIKWTPTENEVNDHFPFCFFVESRDRYYRIYQSEVRCVTADVGHYKTVVRCTESTMTVEVERTYLINRNQGSLHLKNYRDTGCRLSTRSNSTHLVATMALNGCGTTVEEDGDYIVFRNEITSADPSQVITRQNEVEIVFSCVFPKRNNITLGYKHKNLYAFLEKGFGAFTFQFEFYESERFRRQRDPNSYPVEVYLKQMIYMQIKSTASIPNTELFVESCKATPYDNPNSRINYTIISNGCARDSTVRIYPSANTLFRFGMEAFEFIGSHEQVYISCTVILCETGVPGTRCFQGCIQSNGRKRREAASQTSRHSISQGPLHLIKPSDSQVSGPSLNLGMNLVFIAGCLLVCGVVVYRSRRSKAKYQLLVNSESD
ncbi:CUB and zona pellucida-like domain-containing protein 1 [Myripristis murdjan]|uniref:CUB and zona pellucida-like domain-containing protein 1 n=1 Tax=Myripristis murdjan TaxID=586833 RepID=UPI0011762F06|nr:CUB and zona pellucida-like domain-containing protein 1 [Myripristis murdjan]